MYCSQLSLNLRGVDSFLSVFYGQTVLHFHLPFAWIFCQWIFGSLDFWILTKVWKHQSQNIKQVAIRQRMVKYKFLVTNISLNLTDRLGGKRGAAS